jgi:ATP-dependent helicase HrpB
VPLAPLPIDSHIDDLRAALARHRAAVVTAAPGAGKTTRVPPALVDRGRVLLLQPRRVAARAMARRIAEERGWTLGAEIGWHIRFERHFSRHTQLLVVTEGILTAYLQADPLLSDVSTVVVDEFHERSIHADLGLSLVKQAWLARSDLHVVVMSATLDTAPVSAFLGGCPVIDVPGTLHPLTMDHAPGQSVAAALDELLPKTNGNVLCFLQGAGEIAEAIRDAEPAAKRHDVELVPLHGSLDGREQDRALQPDDRGVPAAPTRGARRRVVVATNVAETSLTVPGVSTVVDSGLHKVARYDEERAVDSLVTERVTLDSADQRAGRAARLGPGHVRRLWDARDRLRPHREAEIHRVDLSGAVLALLCWGADPYTFEWFDAPSRDRLDAAMQLLMRLGAQNEGRVSERGRLMQRLPLAPRLARVLIEAKGSAEGCIACAWLNEPTRLDAPQPATTSDVLTVIDRWSRMPPHLRRAAEALEKASSDLLRSTRINHVAETDLRRALLSGFPDRVAKRRAGNKLTLASGHGAIVGRESGVHDAEYLVALDVTSSNRTDASEAIVRVASRVEREWLTPTRSERRRAIDPVSGAVKAHLVEWYDGLILDERPVAVDDESRSEMLAAAWLERAPDPASARLLARLAFAGISVDSPALATLAAHGARNVSDVVLTEAHLSWDQRQQLARHAPERLTVPSGREMTIEYETDGTVSVAVKLQELFGLGDTPLLGPNRVPVTFQLLAPNGRPVQTTRDLRSFWTRTYPEVRKELRGRYPKHPWPDDPWEATPTHRTKRRSV